MRSDLNHLQLNRRQLLVAGAALSVPLLAGCGGGTSTLGSASKGSTGGGGESDIDFLTWDMQEEPKTLDPLTGNGLAISIIHLGTEPFVVCDEKGAVKPLIAESWEQSDALTYRYKIRQGVKFWDGTPLTVEDCVYSILMHKSKKVPSLIFYLTENIASVKAEGKDTVVIKLTEPDSQFEYTPLMFGVVNKAFHEEHGAKVGSPSVLNLGTGPYKFKSFEPGSSVVVERNEDYWGPKPPVREFKFTFIEEEAERLVALQAGEIDGTFDVPLPQLPQYSTLSDVNVETGLGGTGTFFICNVTKAPFDDLYVRKAIAYATDRESMIDVVAPNSESPPAVAVVPMNTMRAFLSDEQVKQLIEKLDIYEYDLGAAKRELAKSKSPEGFTTTAIFGQSEPWTGKLLEILASSLKQIGITLNIQEVSDNAAGNDIFRKHSYAFDVAEFSPDNPDPINNPEYLLASKNTLPTGNLNLAEYRNPEVDALFKKMNGNVSNEERGKILSEILLISQEDLPYIPIYSPAAALAHKEDLKYEAWSWTYYFQMWPYNVSQA
jgi:peptide/nickel transport system substrate-binding protein